MPETYAEQIVQNLWNLRQVALFHPRLAMVGVQSELEIVIQEVLPPKYFATLVRKFHERVPKHRFPDSGAARDELIRLGESVGSKDFVEILRRWAGTSRHTGTVIEVDFVTDGIETAVDFLEALTRKTYKNVLSCPKDRRRSDFHLADVLLARPGTVLELCCANVQCGALSDQIQVSRADDASGLHLKELGAEDRRWALRTLAARMRLILTRQHQLREVTRDEYEIQTEWLTRFEG